MALSAVYIKGFKTFARPVRMPLEGGVTAIVGPNGSGKSNVTDAVLFALGEQSPSVLRAGAMGDLIFSGSETLPAAGAAEVTLVLDNGSGAISLPYREVSVARRISRGGETEYRINGARARLADVRAVAGEAGLGRHSILRQGAVDAIVAGGAAACRLALEETAGLGVYRRRRLAASRRLERADAQLEKSRQLEAELAEQLRRIEKEAAAAREYRELEARHRKLSLAHLYRIATRGLDDRRRRAREGQSLVAGLAAREEALREERVRLEPELRRLEDEVLDRERFLGALEDGVEDLRAESLRADRALLRLEADRSREAERARKVARLGGELRRTERALADVERRSREFEGRRSAARAELSWREKDLTSARKGHTESEDRLARLAGKLDRLWARRADEDEAREKRSSLPVEDLRRLSAVANAVADRDGAPDADRLRGELAEFLSRLEGRRGVAENLAAEANRRRGALAAIVGGVESGIHSLSEAGNGGPGPRLYQVIRARPGFETAVEAALGEVGGGVLAKDLGEGMKLLSGAERVAVRLDARGMEEAARPPGTPLVDCVEVTDERYAEAVGRLLAGIYVVERTDGGAPDNGYVAVTRDGLRLTRTSVSLRGGEGGGFEREARLTAERERLDALEGGPGRILRDLRRTVSDGVGRIEGLATRTRATLALADRAARASAGLIAEADRRRTRAEKDREALLRSRERSEALAREICAAERNLREAEEPGRRAGEVLAVAQEAAEAAYADFQQTDRLLSRLRADATETKKRRDDIRKALGGRRETSEVDVSRRAEALERAARACASLSEAVLARRNRLRRSRAEMAEAHRRANDERNALASRAAELAGELARARAESDRLREELNRAERAASEAAEEIRAEWGATLEAAREESENAPGDVGAERERIARRIKRYGDVNLLALSQESHLRERHRFVAAQRADAEAAAADLDRMIRGIDREIEARFARTFERAREAFGEMVPRMMDGARGELELSEQGVEIGLRLGRRGWRPLNVLSGGERALLALSFLFGIFLSRPGGSRGAFCVLDEAEAALDDTNLARFLAVVDSHRTSGQFLLVTHQKRTMAAADVLYGVTQDASGATVVVSKRLSGE